MKRIFGMKMNIRRRIAAVLVLCMLVTVSASCAEAVETAPELLEPITVSESARPVMRRDIGDAKIINGVVVPTPYPVFTEKNVTIKEIKVDFGDYVEEGDIVALGDTSRYDENIAALSEELEFLQFRREKAVNIAAKLVENLTYEQDREIYANDYEAVLDYSNKIFNEQEDDRYNLALIDSDISSVNERLAEQRRLREKLIFTAPHSGYVTFVKDTSAGNLLETNENVVIISDYNDLYIEAEGLSIKEYKEENVSEHYIMEKGKKVSVEFFEYTKGEMSYAEAVNSFPYVRYLAKGVNLEAGQQIPLYITRNSVNNVLSIGKDSMFMEGDTCFCYVVDSEGHKERRDIVTGMSDKYYVEVKSGLEEGEMVFYENETVMPIKYSEHEVALEDFVEMYSSESVGQLMSHRDIYVAQCDGLLSHLPVSMGNKVAVGDEIYDIDVAVGKGDIADVNNMIIDNNKRHTDMINDLNQTEADLKVALEAAKTAPEPEASDTDAVKESLYRVESLEVDLYLINQEREMEEYRYAYEDSRLKKSLRKLSIGSDNDGTLKVAAENNGKVGKIGVKVNTSVMEGQYLFTVSSAGEKKIMKVNMPAPPGYPAAKLGQEVELIKDGKTYKGKCVGINGNKNKNYLFTRDGKEHLTYSSEYAEGATEQFFVELEDDSVITEDMKGEVQFKGSEIKQGTLVPARAVFSESVGINGDRRYFVWRITDAGLSKQYVVLYESFKASDSFLILYGVEAGDKIAVED